MAVFLAEQDGMNIACQKTFLSTLCSLCLLTGSWVSKAQDSVFSTRGANLYEREAELSVDYAHVILKVAAEIEENGDHKKSEILHSDESFKNFYESYQKHFVNFYEEKFQLTQEETSQLSYYLKQIKAKNWRPIGQELFQLGRTYLRSGGPGMALAFTIGNISKYAVPFALYKAGLTGLAFVAYMSPWLPVSLAFPKMIERLNYRRKMKKLLGGKREYLDYKNMSQVFYERVGLKTPEHFLHPLDFQSDGAIRAISLKTSGIWQVMMGRLGLGQKSISLYSLRSFLFLHGGHVVDEEKIKAITNRSVPQKIKIIQLVQGIYQLGDDELIQKFEENFRDSFVNIQNIPHWEKGLEWVQKMQDARSIGRMKSLIQEIPPEVDAREIMALWEEILLPRYARDYQFSYDSYRKLIDDFQSLKVELYKSPQKSWGEFSSRFEHYFLEGAMQGQWEKCHPDLPSIFKLLTLKSDSIHPPRASDNYPLGQRV